MRCGNRAARSRMPRYCWPERERFVGLKEKGAPVRPTGGAVDARNERKHGLLQPLADQVCGRGRRHESYANCVSCPDKIRGHVAHQPGRLPRIGNRPCLVPFRSTACQQHADKEQWAASNPNGRHLQFPHGISWKHRHTGHATGHRSPCQWRPISRYRPAKPLDIIAAIFTLTAR